MSKDSRKKQEMEDRAFEALIVTAMREEPDINNLPELNDKERAAMDSLPDDFVEQLWRKAKQ